MSHTEAQTFSAAFRAHYADVLNFVRRRVGDVAHAEDLTAEVLARAWQGWPASSASGATGSQSLVRPWLFGIRGVELLDAATDSLGRAAVAVRLDLTEANWYRETLWFNPDDGAVLETELYSPFEAAERQSVRVITLEQGWRDDAPVPNWINGVGPITDNN